MDNYEDTDERAFKARWEGRTKKLWCDTCKKNTWQNVDSAWFVDERQNFLGFKWYSQARKVSSTCDVCGNTNSNRV